MAQIIVSSRYLKSGKRGKTKRRNYTKYIATRESVEKRLQNTGKIPREKWLLLRMSSVSI